MNSEFAKILYDSPTMLLVSILLASMLVANEIGFRFGRRAFQRETDLSRGVASALKGSIFGLVALLLGFSFSATTSRHDIRQRLVLDQANAIGTCYLRAGLLSLEFSQQIQPVLRTYVDSRIAQYKVAHDESKFARLQKDMDAKLSELWNAVEIANHQDPNAVRTSMIVPAANEVIDLSSTRAWANRNHLPNAVLILLLASVIISCLLLGHSSGQSNRRHVGLWIASNVVCALVLYVILDYDRPRRGLIKVDHTPLLELQTSISSP